MAKAIQTAYAYCAGLIDGEGCISIDRKKRYRSNNIGNNQYKNIIPKYSWDYDYGMMIIVVTKDMKLTEYLRGIFSGNIYWTNRKNPDRRFRRWVIQSNLAFKALKKMLPYFILKKEQAQNAIEFQKTINRQFQKNKHTKVIPEKDLQIREKFFERQKQLKRAVVETNS